VNVTKKPTSAVQGIRPAWVSTHSIWCIETTPVEISNASRIEDESRIGFREALDVASALRADNNRILSEDLNAGHPIAGIRLENPFAKDWLSHPPWVFLCISHLKLVWSRKMAGCGFGLLYSRKGFRVAVGVRWAVLA
jgi:hypothetical protein